MFNMELRVFNQCWKFICKLTFCNIVIPLSKVNPYVILLPFCSFNINVFILITIYKIDNLVKGKIKLENFYFISCFPVMKTMFMNTNINENLVVLILICEY